MTTAKKKTEKKTWYFIAWEERHPRRPGLYTEVHNDVTDEHPIVFLAEARKVSIYVVSILWWQELDCSDAQAKAWQKMIGNERP
jgi:hypothetical protein